MYIRVKGDGEEWGEYIEFDLVKALKTPKTYLALYHTLTALIVGWPAHWLTLLSKRHSNWMLREYKVSLFRKRVESFDEEVGEKCKHGVWKGERCFKCEAEQ